MHDTKDWLQFLPLAAIVVLFFFLRSELSIFISLCVIIAIFFLIRYEQGEWKLFVVGVLLGLLCEIGGDRLYRLQYWAGASVLSIPVWLPLLWGIGFVLIRRGGNLLLASAKKK